MNPFSIVRQTASVKVRLRLGDPFWRISDIEMLIRKIQDLSKAKWYLSHIRQIDDVNAELIIFRTVSAWRAFFDPAPLKENE